MMVANATKRLPFEKKSDSVMLYGSYLRAAIISLDDELRAATIQV